VGKVVYSLLFIICARAPLPFCHCEPGYVKQPVTVELLKLIVV